jgi:hypothetical protein
MNGLRKNLCTGLIATAALLGGVSPTWAQVSLGAASGFSVLGGGAVTCTNSVIAGDVGAGGALANTGCTIAGGMPPATNPAVAGALAGLAGAYGAIQTMLCPIGGTLLSTITGPMTLAPGVYCTAAALTGAGVLTLDAGGNANAVWIFKIPAAFTGTGFSVVMANGGQACNVYWAPGADVTLTTSALSGNILAGGATGSVTMTGGTLAGRILATSAVTMTGTNLIGCGALPGPPPSSCKDKDRDGNDKCKDDRDGGKDKGKCSNGDDDDKSRSAGQSRYPFESKGKDGKK